jgi:hypothetical protein
VRQVEGLLVNLLQRASRGDPAQHEEHHRCGADNRAGGSRRRGEQVTGVVRGLAVQAGGPGQCLHHRPTGQRADDDEKREEAQQQRGGEQHAPVDDIDRDQPAPQVFGPGPGILRLAPLSCPPDLLPAWRAGHLHACSPGSRRLARSAGGLTRGIVGPGSSIYPWAIRLI